MGGAIGAVEFIYRSLNDEGMRLVMMNGLLLPR